MAIAGQAFVVGVLETPVGTVPRVAAVLAGRDRWGTLLVRLGFGRMRYTVEPGLYGVGAPTEDSPVLVTANYVEMGDVVAHYAIINCAAVSLPC